MPLFRIVAGLFFLAVFAVVLSFVFNVLKALLIVGVVGLAIGLWLGLRRGRRKPNERQIEK